MVKCLASLHKALSRSLSVTGGKEEGRERWKEGGGGGRGKETREESSPSTSGAGGHLPPFFSCYLIETLTLSTSGDPCLFCFVLFLPWQSYLTIVFARYCVKMRSCT